MYMKFRKTGKTELWRQRLYSANRLEGIWRAIWDAVMFCSLIQLSWKICEAMLTHVFLMCVLFHFFFFNFQNMAMSKVLPSCVPMTWTLWCDIIGGKKSLTSTWSELEPGPIISWGLSLIVIPTFFACYRRVSSTVFQGCCKEWRLKECAGTMEIGGVWSHLCPSLAKQ